MKGNYYCDYFDSCTGRIIHEHQSIDANPRVTNYIVGGYETTIEENPWQVTLLLRGTHRCGASIISDRWILTAAHCTEYEQIKFKFLPNFNET